MKDYKYIITDRGYNYLPEPYKFVSFNEFIQAISNNKIYDVEFRQIKNTNKNILLNTNIFYMDIVSYAVCIDNNNIFYYKIGCEHDFESENIGNCYNKLTCKKCGIVQNVDSSD